MPGDARLGLVVGVGLVILAAVLFHRDGSLVISSPAHNSATISPPGKGEESRPPRVTTNPPAIPVAFHPSSLSGLVGRVHTVLEGETLAELARRYYGDGRHSSVLFEANRDQLLAPDRLTPGIVLLVPDLPPENAAQESISRIDRP